jgi:hypothetical protein
MVVKMTVTILPPNYATDLREIEEYFNVPIMSQTDHDDN